MYRHIDICQKTVGVKKTVVVKYRRRCRKITAGGLWKTGLFFNKGNCGHSQKFLSWEMLEPILMPCPEGGMNEIINKWTLMTRCPPGTGFESWRSETKHVTSSWSQRLPEILNLYECVGKTHLVFETWIPEWGTSLLAPSWQASSFYTGAPIRVVSYRDSIILDGHTWPQIAKIRNLIPFIHNYI